jgi:hypothetical protein
MLNVGISKEAFRSGYRKANEDIIKDLPYGSVMRFITITLARYGMLDAVVRAAETDGGLRDALFGAVSAEVAYRPVLMKALLPRRVLGVIRSLLKRKGRTGLQGEEVDRQVT